MRLNIVQVFMQFGQAVTAIELVYGNRLEANKAFDEAVNIAEANAGYDLAEKPATLYEHNHDKGRVALPSKAVVAAFMRFEDQPDIGAALPGLPQGNRRLS